MTQLMQSNWQGSWIWGGVADSPRNEWRCFRRTFRLEESASDSAGAATLRLTADSRYVLYVNGVRVGRGPVRSWPTELAYDEYEIGHLLHTHKENVVAVMVIHYGLSTFQYLRGRGGLVVEVGLPDSAVVSDASWKTAIHAGHDPRTSRISCQLGFTEVVDARKWDDSWTLPDYDDGAWEQASVIGQVGMAPWTQLVERDIPYLTEEPIYPSRVEALSAVKPPTWSAVLDVRSVMMPDSAEHANPIEFCGYLATVITLEQAGQLTLGSADSGRAHLVLYVDGKRVEDERFFGEIPERYVKLELSAGAHLLMIDTTGSSHGHGFHFGVDSDAPFELLAPCASETPFVRVGPFDTNVMIDHQPGRELRRDHPDYAALASSATVEELLVYERWLAPVEACYMNTNDVFTSCVWKTKEEAYPIPSSLQHIVLAGSHGGEIPVYAGMDTEVVIDFGRELNGYIAFELDAEDGTILDGYGFEYMRDGWRQHTYVVDNTFRYVCSEGRQSYVSHIRRGLRYLTLTVRGAARPVKLYDLKLLQSNFPVANVGRFHSSDPLLNDIWTISRDTTRLCMEDTFVDCPAFEQAFWVGDARNEALVNYYTFGAREIVERCLKLVPGSAFQTPLYADQVPSGWNSVIPNWTFFWVTACLEYYRFDGQREFAESLWPHVKLTLEQYLTLRDERGLLNRSGWNLLDWAPFEQPREGVVTPQNMFMVKALRDGAELAKFAGEENAGLHFLEEAEKLRAAIDEHLWHDKRAAYVDCIHPDGRFSESTSMQSQIAAYLCDITEGERKEKIERYIIDPPKDFVPAGSPFMLFFLYEALVKLGRTDLMLEDMRQQYGFMIENEATSCWEMFPWSGYNKNPKLLTRSHCHAWSAGPGYFLGQQVLGVEGLTPGWTEVRVAPQLGGLSWARGSVPLPHGGRIDVSWRLVKEGQLSLRVEAPASVKIVVEAPQGYELQLELVQ